MNHLRRLTVFVDEPDPGVFFWVVIESADDAAVWGDVEASMGSYDTWGAAWEAGGKALLTYVTDPAIGPRADGEDESADPVG